MPAGSGGRDAHNLDELQKSSNPPREDVLVGPLQEGRRPFALVQHAGADGVEILIGTFTGPSTPKRELQSVQGRMPEGVKQCKVAAAGRRWDCWMGTVPPPGRGTDFSACRS